MHLNSSSRFIARALGCLLGWQLCVGPVMAQTQPEAVAEEKIVARLNEISRLHRNLFSEFSVDLQLPVRVGSVGIPVWTVEDLVEQLSANALDAGVRNTVVNLLDAAVVEKQAGYFLLDDEAREAVRYWPKALRAALTSTDITDHWGVEENPTSGWYGAKHYLIQRDAAVTRLEGATPEQKRELWLVHLRSFAFINNKYSAQEQARKRHLLDRQLNAGFSQPALTGEERSEIERLGVGRGGLGQKFSDPKSANTLYAVALSSKSIAGIVASRNRRNWSTSDSGLVGAELRRVADRLIEVLPQGQAERLAGLEINPLAIDTDDTGNDGSSAAHQRALWFMASRHRGVPTIQGTGSAVFAGFSVCAVSSAWASNWTVGKLLFAMRRQSTQGPKTRWLQTPEDDYHEHVIFKLPLITDSDDLTSPINFSNNDIIEKNNDIIENFDRCVNNYFAFVLAHELAHIYLDDTGQSVEVDESKVDCAAMRHVRQLQERFPQFGEVAPTQGFMKHLLEAANSLEQPLTTEGFLKDEFKERYAVMLQGGCGNGTNGY